MTPFKAAKQTPNRPKWMLFGLSAVLGVLCAFALLLRSRPDAKSADPLPSNKNEPYRQTSASTAQKPVAVTSVKGSPRRPVPVSTNMRLTASGATNRMPVRPSATAHAHDTKWTPLIARMQSSMDDGDSEGALVCARQLMTAPDTGARRTALDMFRWLGSKAMTEMTRMLSDPDDEIAQLALEGWLMALDEITDHAAYIQTAAKAVATLTDQAARQSLMMKISLLPDAVAAAYYVAMLDVQDREVVELALEYLTFMAQTPIENKADAARWVASLQAAAP